jgi:hypothetical protein
VSKDLTGTKIDRLRALTAAYRDARETFEVHRDRWQEAIVALVDEGAKPADVGAVVGVTAQRVQAIVARIYARDDQS